jgi:aminoglycoside phosphotransferase (APT) family kinase protein
MLRRLVFRRPPQIEIFPDYDLLRQVLVMNRLAHTSVTVPAVCWLHRGDDALGTPSFVMEQLPTVGGPGDVPSYHSAGMYLDASPEQRAAMWWGCVQAIADVTRWTGAR